MRLLIYIKYQLILIINLNNIININLNNYLKLEQTETKLKAKNTFLFTHKKREQRQSQHQICNKLTSIAVNDDV